MSMGEAWRAPADGQEGTGDAQLKERLHDMAVTRSSVVRNGRFFFYSELNAITYWYEDHTNSTRMVMVEAER